MNQDCSNRRAPYSRRAFQLVGSLLLAWIGVQQYRMRNQGVFGPFVPKTLLEDAAAMDKTPCGAMIDRKRLYDNLVDVFQTLNRFDERGNDVSYLSRIPIDPVTINNRSKRNIRDLLHTLEECPNSVLQITAFPETFSPKGFH